MGIIIKNKWRVIRGFVTRDDAVNFAGRGYANGRMMVEDPSGRFAYLLVEEYGNNKSLLK